MSELASYPTINQENEPTSDGQIDENANDNCVPASIATVLEYFTRKKFNGDELKDLVYGQGYRGLQDAANFVSIVASHGVHMQQYRGSLSWITNQIHEQLKNGNPVLCYVPWDYNFSVPHAVVFMAEAPGKLQAMNPWGGIFQWRSDSEWQNRGVGFFYDVMWMFSSKMPVQEDQGLILHDDDPFFKNHFKRVAADRIHCPSTNKDVAFAILNHYLNTGGQARLPISGEFAIAPGATAQIFESLIVVYDPKRVFDNPELPGDCYFVKITSGKGQHIIAQALLDPLNTKIAELQQQLAAVQATHP